MKTFFLALPLLAATMCSLAFANPAQVYAQQSSAVVLIVASTDTTRSRGTGFVIAPHRILTNAHVIEDASGNTFEKLIVFSKQDNFNDGTLTTLQGGMSAQVVALDRALDLALLQVDGLKDTPAISFADSAQVAIGSDVLAIGHPENGGLWSLTSGRIGAKIKNHGQHNGRDVLQTEAPLNRGNSGGPLLNWDGSLIGVNSSMARQSKEDGLAITGINFALESNVARSWLQNQGVNVAFISEGTEPTLQESTVIPERNTFEQPTDNTTSSELTPEQGPVQPLLLAPREDGLLSKPRPFTEYQWQQAFIASEKRAYQNFQNQQQDAFRAFKAQ